MTVTRIDLGLEYLGGIRKPTVQDVGKFATIELDAFGDPQFAYQPQLTLTADNAFATALAPHLASASVTVDGSGNLVVATASESVPGIVELASAAEANALSATDRAVAPGRIPIASETQRGVVELATAAEANALSSNALAVSPANLPITSTTQQGLIELATAGEMETGTDTTRAVTPGLQHRHHSACKAWARSTPGDVLSAGYNVSSVTDAATGIAIFTYATPFTGGTYVLIPAIIPLDPNPDTDSDLQFVCVTATQAATCTITSSRIGAAAGEDPTAWMIAVWRNLI